MRRETSTLQSRSKKTTIDFTALSNRGVKAFHNFRGPRLGF